ncbi:NADH-quinone oxidoreductase subunit NuoE, partial [Streptomyces sp. KLMMK]
VGPPRGAPPSTGRRQQPGEHLSSHARPSPDHHPSSSPSGTQQPEQKTSASDPDHPAGPVTEEGEG